MGYKSDIEIAREADKKQIQEIGIKLGIESKDLLPYGHDKAKVSQEFINSVQGNKNDKLVLVTAINPTPAGEGKTTTTVGLGDGLNRIGKKAAVCIREASLGPNFGMKGGAAGGGYAHVDENDSSSGEQAEGDISLDYTEFRPPVIRTLNTPMGFRDELNQAAISVLFEMELDVILLRHKVCAAKSEPFLHLFN